MRMISTTWKNEKEFAGVARLGYFCQGRLNRQLVDTENITEVLRTPPEGYIGITKCL